MDGAPSDRPFVAWSAWQARLVDCRRSSRRIRRLETTLDHVGFERLEAVEADRGIRRRIGAGSLDHDLAADLQRHRQQVWLLLVQDVDRVATRPRDDTGAKRIVVVFRPDRIADHLVLRFGETVEPADVEVDPALLVLVRLLRDQHHFGLDDSRVAHHAAAWLDDRLRNLVAEVSAWRPED